MAHINLTRSRIFGIGLATAALAFAACGHSNSTPTAPTPSPTPVSVVSAGPTSAACVISLGLAYEPDAGNGHGFTGIQEVHYEGNTELPCGAGGPTSTPLAVRFPSSVGEFAIGTEGSDGIIDAVAIDQNTNGGYSLVQDVFGGAAGNLVPAGSPYDASIQPPTATPSAGATASASTAPVINDITSVTTIGGGADGLAVIVGPAASPPALVAVTSLSNAPPEFGLSVGFNEPTATYTGAPNFPRSIVKLDSVTSTSGTPMLVRSQSDLLLFSVTSASQIGYQLNAEADDQLLGTGIAMRGNGNIAFDPANYTRALIGGTTSGNQAELTLLTGLPTALTETATLAMPGPITSIDIATNGEFALVGTTVGIVVVSGINTTVLSIVSPFAPSPLAATANAIPYTNCNGTSSLLTDIYSVRFGDSYASSTVNAYLVALGSAPGVTCASGANASLVAIPFDTATGATPAPSPSPTVSPSPAPTAVGASPTPLPTASPPPFFVQNNMIAPPAGSDLLVTK